MFRPLTKDRADLAPPPVIIGFVFKRRCGYCYKKEGGVLALHRKDAYIFCLSEIMMNMRSKRRWGWGTKQYGHWVAVYARTPVDYSYGGY